MNDPLLLPHCSVRNSKSNGPSISKQPRQNSSLPHCQLHRKSSEQQLHVINKNGENRPTTAGKYVDYKIEEVLYDTSSNYDGLVRIIASQIGLDITTVELVIQYVVSLHSPPLKIHNDMGVKVYLDQKRFNSDFFSKYPLCVTYIDRAVDTITIEPNNEIIMTQTIASVDLGLAVSDTVLVDFSKEDQETDVISNTLIDLVAEGQIYINKHTLAEVMHRYALLRQFRFKVVRSCTVRFNLKCTDDNCSWFFRSSCLGKSGLFKVRMFNDEHTCPSGERLNSKRQSTSGVLCSMLLPKYSDTKTIYTPSDIRADMKRKHGISLTYMQAWRGKQKAMKILRGDPEESYSKIPMYHYILEQAYPGTIVNLKKTKENKFLYSFIALDASIRGWEYCRPIVVVDGTHIRSTFEGTMLIASTLDPGGHILPLAYGVVDSENDKSWSWFFENFKVAFGDREGMCFVSDRNKSIWNATASVYPDIKHYACIYHLWANLLKKAHKNVEEVRKLFFNMAKAYTVQEFNELMDRMDEINPKIRPYLVKADFEKWSRCHTTVKRTWTLTSNIVESINNAILPGRKLPVVPMLEYMRKTIECWNEKHNEEGRKTTTVLTKKYNQMLMENKRLSNRMTVRASTEHLHTVVDGAKRFTVCLNTRVCSCGRFQHDEIPCSHAIAAIEYRNKQVGDFCSIYYSNKNFQDTYAIPIEPLPCESTWVIPTHVLEEIVLPPTTRRRPGRPANKDRKKGFNEVKCKKSKITCSLCGIPGHNKKNCTEIPCDE